MVWAFALWIGSCSLSIFFIMMMFVILATLKLSLVGTFCIGCVCRLKEEVRIVDDYTLKCVWILRFNR